MYDLLVFSVLSIIKILKVSKKFESRFVFLGKKISAKRIIEIIYELFKK